MVSICTRAQNQKSKTVSNALLYLSFIEIPKGYAPIQIRNISFVGNLAFGTLVSAPWECSPLDPCHEIIVMDNYIADSINNPWTCHNVKSFTVSGNHPAGLAECMEESMNQTWVSLRSNSMSVPIL